MPDKDKNGKLSEENILNEEVNHPDEKSDSVEVIRDVKLSEDFASNRMGHLLASDILNSGGDEAQTEENVNTGNQETDTSEE